MNSRIASIIAVITLISVLMIKLALNTEFILGEYIWQSGLAVLVVILLARGVGAIEITEERPLLIALNNEVKTRGSYETNVNFAQESNAQINLSTKMVELLETLTKRINQLETNIENRTDVSSKSVKNYNEVETENIQNPQIDRVYKAKPRYREVFGSKQNLNVAQDSSNVQSTKKISMLHSIFKDNEELQKKAS